MREQLQEAKQNFSRETINQVFWQASTNDQRPKFKLQINGIDIEDLVDTGADVIIISPKSWHPD